MRARRWCVAVLAFAVAACGDDRPPSGTDAGGDPPDATADDGSPPSMDSTLPPAGACTPTEQESLLTDAMAHTDCAARCAEDETCRRDCLAEETGVPTECAECVIVLQRCGARECATECPGDGCLGCLCGRGCVGELAACSGVDPMSCIGIDAGVPYDGGSCAIGAESTAAACADGCDNDGDGSFDCADGDCRGVGSCPGDGCTPGATRCVVGDASAVELCNASGVWESQPCGTAQLCSRSACRVVCDLTSPPVDPYICFVPNEDGVNDGVLFYSNDTPRLDPTMFAGPFVRSSSRLDASIQAIPSSSPSSVWPYEWTLRATADLRHAAIVFRLDQFSALPGPLRTVTFRYLARKEPAIVIPPDVYIDYQTRAWRYAGTQTSGIFFVNDEHILGTTYSLASSEGLTIAGVAGVNQFDHAGGWNEMGIEIQGNGFGDPPMRAYVNWILLIVQ